jgi:hypothetical protein
MLGEARHWIPEANAQELCLIIFAKFVLFQLPLVGLI